jgi:hypothetical protein
MGKGVRTVQRWERDFGLPVRRPPGLRNRRAVLALPTDLDAWVALSCSRLRHITTAVPGAELARTLGDHVKEAAELRIANRLLMNEIHIAMEALKQKISSMCPPPPMETADLAKNHRVHYSGLPN